MQGNSIYTCKVGDVIQMSIERGYLKVPQGHYLLGQLAFLGDFPQQFCEGLPLET